MRSTTDTATRFGRLGLVTAAAAAVLLASPLAAYADTPVTTHWAGNLKPGQEQCMSDKGVKAFLSGTATNGGARFRGHFNNVQQYDSGKGSLGISNVPLDYGRGTYQECVKNPNDATMDTYVTIDLAVVRRP